MEAHEAIIWARSAEVSDPGSRCGYGDDTLDQIERVLRERGLTLDQPRWPEAPV